MIGTKFWKLKAEGRVVTNLVYLKKAEFQASNEES